MNTNHPVLGRWATAALVLTMTAATAISAPFFFEDFSAYPPGSTNALPDHFRAFLSVSLETTNSQSFSWHKYTEEDGYLVCWRMVRNTTFSEHNQRRLVYAGPDPLSEDPAINPFLWEDYTVRTVFETDNTGGNRALVHARLQNSGHLTSGYIARWQFGYPLAIGLNAADGNTSMGTVLAESTNSLSITANTLYTIELVVEGPTITANLYQGTDLTAPGALKMTVTTNDTTYTAGSFAIGMRAPGTSHRIDFHQIEVIPEPAALTLFGLAGLALFRRRRRLPGEQ